MFALSVIGFRCLAGDLFLFNSHLSLFLGQPCFLIMVRRAHLFISSFRFLLCLQMVFSGEGFPFQSLKRASEWAYFSHMTTPKSFTDLRIEYACPHASYAQFCDCSGKEARQFFIRQVCFKK